MPIEGLMNLYQYINVLERKVIPVCEGHFLKVEENSNRVITVSLI